MGVGMKYLIRRLKSKTFWAVVCGATVTAFEVNSGFFSGLMPVQYQPFLIAFWPVLMLVLREFTTKPLSEK